MRGVWGLGWLLVWQVILSWLLLSNVYAYQATNSMTVTATVEPHRYIIADDRSEIKQIISNTNLDVTPEVFVDKFGGQKLAYSSKIAEQYENLRFEIDFSNPGQVYEKANSNPLPSLKSILIESLVLSLKLVP